MKLKDEGRPPRGSVRRMPPVRRLAEMTRQLGGWDVEQIERERKL